jgi:hypothetical protein
MIARNQLANKEQGQALPLTNLHRFTPAFFELLKKTQRHLHLNTLECLEALTERYPAQF